MTIWVPNISSASGPIYKAVADALEADIRAGVLAVGDRLPPQRELAYQLGVTLGTITRAYAEAERRRLVHGETGRGTFISQPSVPASPLLPEAYDTGDLELARNFAYPHLNPSLSKALARLAGKPETDRLDGFIPSEGLLSHREAGARLFERYGLQADPARIAVTCGAQHGIQVLLQAFFRPGDAVAVDAFAYPSILQSAITLGLRLVPIPALKTAAGWPKAMDPDALRKTSRQQGLRGIFLMPNMQNPTTHMMTLDERKALVDVARDENLAIIEDDPYTGFLTDPPPALGTLAPERTGSIASVSKLISPGSRIGFVHVPGTHFGAVRNLIGESVWMASPITAELVACWIRDGELDRTLERKRSANAHRYALALNYLGPDRLQSGPDKVFAWLHLPCGADPSLFEAEMARRGVRLLASPHFQVSGQPPAPCVRLTFGGVLDDASFERALCRIAEVLNQPAGQGLCRDPVG